MTTPDQTAHPAPGKVAHTPEPWRWLPDEGNFIVAVDDERIIAEVPCASGNPHDGARIVALVNAAAGLTVEEVTRRLAPPPADSWRLLNEGEVIEASDEYYNVNEQEWQPYGDRSVARLARDDDWPVRRRVRLGGGGERLEGVMPLLREAAGMDGKWSLFTIGEQSGILAEQDSRSSHKRSDALAERGRALLEPIQDALCEHEWNRIMERVDVCPKCKCRRWRAALDAEGGGR